MHHEPRTVRHVRNKHSRNKKAHTADIDQMRCIIILSLIWVAAYKSDEMGKLMEIVKKTHFSIDMNGETYFSDLGKG